MNVYKKHMLRNLVEGRHMMDGCPSNGMLELITELQQAGLVWQTYGDSDGYVRYAITEAGRELVAGARP